MLKYFISSKGHFYSKRFTGGRLTRPLGEEGREDRREGEGSEVPAGGRVAEVPVPAVVAGRGAVLVPAAFPPVDVAAPGHVAA